ncbi:NAD-dependent DNA ligase LigA [Conexibacter sp. SYSU D00693]|uniref:NAD-dependent DNA ligase LigA n=1 Tax=Conexibacter sp. SYSU D00693 TaxID=2812560 RepID=UPI00196AA791|nr:NAD-dependent DNA ligase LigA [Conexibacter sp. SYSU D00693]
MTEPGPAERIAELAELLRHHRDLYYRGVPELPDADYDALEDELRALVAKHPDLAPPDSPLATPGAPAKLEGQTIRHQQRMLSLDKANQPEQVATFMGRFPGQRFRVTPKLDGLSLSLVYEDGALAYAATRGDGTIGELVTHAIKHVVPELPLEVPAQGRVEVRGEAVMLRSTFAAYNEAHPDRPLVNPRNGAAGTLRHKDPEACARDGRVLTFIGFDLLGGLEDRPFDEALRELGFTAPEADDVDDADGAIAAVTRIGEQRPQLDFDIDGAVIRLASRAAFEAAGATSSAPRGALAFKFPAEERSTTLKAVTWQVGKIGRVAPVAELEPVFVGGTTISRATLHNPAMIAARDIRVGDRVVVRRAGDVIPFIAASIESERTGDETEIAVPEHCPSCGTPLVVKGEGQERWCENLTCPAQGVRRLIHATSRPAFDMEAVGPTWTERLAEDGLLTRISDFFRLTKDQLLAYDGMGEVSATRMLESIASSKGVGLRRAFIALAVPMAAGGVAQRLCQHGFARLEDVAEASEEELQQVDDVGPKVAASVHAFFAREEVRRELADLRELGVDLDVAEEDRPVDVAEAAETPLKGATVVVTGAISHHANGATVTRPDFTKLLERAGATAASSVSGNTDMLITGANVGASKTAKAEKLGVQVVDQEQAWRWLVDAGLA